MLIVGNNIYGDDQDFSGTQDITTEILSNRLLGTAAANGTATTIASGIATLPNGIEYVRVNGEGSTSDDLTNVVPMRRVGSVVRCLANHELTLKNYTGSDGKIITGTGGDLVVPQYAIFTLVSDDPNWIVSAVSPT